MKTAKNVDGTEKTGFPSMKKAKNMDGTTAGNVDEKELTI